MRNVTLSYDFEPGGGMCAFVAGPLVERQLTKGFNGFADQLESATSR